MKTFIRLVLFIVLLAALGAAYLAWQKQQRGAQTPAEMTIPPMRGESTGQIGPRHPIPVPTAPSAAAPTVEGAPMPPSQEAVTTVAEPPAAPLPVLSESTPTIAEALTGLFGAESLGALFHADEIIRRLVVTVDNLPADKLPRQRLLVKRAAGPFLVAGDEHDRVISADNAARYAPYVRLAASADVKQWVDVYVRFYPLFQSAYAELGKPNAYFNDRLIEVIDHLLDTPVVQEPIRLVQPKVFYLYADAELEALSAGQKILLRMGGANAEMIKTRLRELRAALTREPSPR